MITGLENSASTNLNGLASGFSDGVRALIQPLIGLFKDEQTGPFLAGAISLVAFGIVCLIAAKWFVAYRRIQKAQEIIKCADGRNESAKRQAFLKKYDEIDAKLSGPKAPLHDAWREFRETLILPDLNDPDETSVVVDNSARPHQFFNAEAAGAGFAFLKSVPNIFVGVGLVLTFVGLVAALEVATANLDASHGDPALMKDALGGLLTTAAAKFYASMAALGWSIILTILVKWAALSTRSQLHGLNNMLEERLLFANAESIANKQLKVMEEQKVQLETFNADVAADIGRAIKREMEVANDGLVQELREISATFKDLVTTSGKATSEAVNQAIDTELSAVLRDVTQTLQAVSGAMAGIPSKLEAAVADLHGKSGDAVREAEARMRSVGSEMHATLNEGAATAAQTLASSASEISSTFLDLSARSDALALSMEQSAKVHQELVAKLAAGSDCVQESTNALRLAAAPITEGALQVTKSSEALREFLKDAVTGIREAQDSITNHVGMNQEILEKHVGRFDEVDEKLGGVFKQINSQIERQVDALRERVTDIDNHLGKAVDHLGQHIEDLMDAQQTGQSAKRRIEEFSGAPERSWPDPVPAE